MDETVFVCYLSLCFLEINNSSNIPYEKDNIDYRRRSLMCASIGSFLITCIVETVLMQPMLSNPNKSKISVSHLSRGDAR